MDASLSSRFKFDYGRVFYYIGSLLLCLGYFCCGARFVLRRSNSAARGPLLVSIIYLPLLFVLMMLVKR
jgi:heme O synthase-like polyprenyltransferase